MNDTSNCDQAISKMLSANDTGETGGHQSGILVPKRRTILAFFPQLDASEKNPRRLLAFRDDCGDQWEFAFIYYNSRFFGGTRNEFRLTRMTPFLRMNGLVPGDELILGRDVGGRRFVTYRRARQSGMGADGVLRLSAQWKIIKY